MNSILAVAAAILAVYSLLLGRKASKLSKKINEIEQEHLHDKLEAIEKEREHARKRLRNLLDHYRGDGPKGSA